MICKFPAASIKSGNQCDRWRTSILSGLCMPGRVIDSYRNRYFFISRKYLFKFWIF